PAAAASSRMRWPRRYWSVTGLRMTNPFRSRDESNRRAVLLCNPARAASSVNPRSVSATKQSSRSSARSTARTVVLPSYISQPSSHVSLCETMLHPVYRILRDAPIVLPEPAIRLPNTMGTNDRSGGTFREHGYVSGTMDCRTAGGDRFHFVKVARLADGGPGCRLVHAFGTAVR